MSILSVSQSGNLSFCPYHFLYLPRSEATWFAPGNPHEDRRREEEGGRGCVELSSTSLDSTQGIGFTVRISSRPLSTKAFASLAAMTVEADGESSRGV